MRTFFKLTLATVVAAVVLAMPTQANAAFVMKLTSSSAGVKTITDGGGDDSAGAAGQITFLGGWGAFSIQVDTGLTKPILGTAANPAMDLNYVVVRTGGTTLETLTIEISDTDYTRSPTKARVNFGGTNGLTNSTTSSATAGIDYQNLNFVTDDASISLGTFGSGAFAAANSFGINAPGVYSLTIGVTISSTGPTSASGNLALAVPEPASFAMWGIGALGMMFAFKRRQTKLVA